MESGKLQRDHEFDLELISFDDAGSAYGRTERLVADQPRAYRVNVPGAIPGDRVRAQVTKARKRRASARALSVLSPSPSRVVPTCTHAMRLAEAGPFCGGCALQHMDYEAQLEAKHTWVKRQMTTAGLDHVRVQPVRASVARLGYRNKMEYSCTHDRHGQVALGLYPRGYRYEVMSLTECHLQSEQSARLLVAAGDWIRARGLQPFGHGRSETPGFVRTVTIREGKRTGERMVELTTSGAEHALMDGGEQPAAAVAAAFSEFVEAHGDVTSWHWTRHHAQKGMRTRFETHHLGGKAALYEELHVPGARPLRFEIHPRAFFQPNSFQAEILYGEVLAATGLASRPGEQRVLDLYCGTGTIGLCVAEFAREVVGVELNPEAVANARKNAADNRIGNATFHAGDAAKVLVSEGLDQPGAVDLVIVDPPRNGLSEPAVNSVAAIGAQRVVYVSCNPASLARDLGRFAALGYHTDSVQPVDMFPHTFHVENVAVLERRSR